MSPNVPRMCTLPEVAKAARAAVKTVRGWCQRGKFPGARRVGGRWLVPERELSRFLGVEGHAS